MNLLCLYVFYFPPRQAVDFCFTKPRAAICCTHRFSSRLLHTAMDLPISCNLCFVAPISRRVHTLCVLWCTSTATSCPWDTHCARKKIAQPPWDTHECTRQHPCKHATNPLTKWNKFWSQNSTVVYVTTTKPRAKKTHLFRAKVQTKCYWKKPAT